MAERMGSPRPGLAVVEHWLAKIGERSDLRVDFVQIQH